MAKLALIDQAAQIEELHSENKEIKELRSKTNTAILEIQKQFCHQIKNLEQQIAGQFSMIERFIESYKNVETDLKHLVNEFKTKNEIKNSIRRSFIVGAFTVLGGSLAGGLIAIMVFIVHQYLNSQG